MDIHFRDIANLEEETSIGHKLWFYPVTCCQAISATANPNGFTPLIAIARFFNWRRDLLEAASFECNRQQQVVVVKNIAPTLLLVPATKGKGDASRLAMDLLNISDQLAVKNLHLTHYGFLQGKPPLHEMHQVILEIMNRVVPGSQRSVFFDVDVRAKIKLRNLLFS